MKKSVVLFLVVFVGLVFNDTVRAQGHEMGTAFTFDGKLSESGSPAMGIFDFRFKLYDEPNDIGGVQLGPTITKEEVDLVDGTFTAVLDFGREYDGNARWLQIGVRPGEQSDPCEYVIMEPWKELTPTPYSLHTYGLLVDPDQSNVFAGVGAGENNTTGDSNTFLGHNAGKSNTNANNNTFLGNSAGYTSNGYYNTFVGYNAGYFNTDGTSNAFFGYMAGHLNSTGNQNTSLGRGAGKSNRTGIGNTYTGYQAGYNTKTSSNTFLGSWAGYSNDDGNQHTFLGSEAGYFNETGNKNIFIGYRSGFNNHYPSELTFIGYESGFSNRLGTENTFLGYQAGRTNRDGLHNTFFGYQAGYSNQDGEYNTFFGYQAGYSNYDSGYNTFVGTGSGYTNTEGDWNTFTGYQSGYTNDGGYSNTFSGYQAGYSNTDGYMNTFVGNSAGRSNTTGNSNTFVGRRAGYSNMTGDSNVFIGHQAGFNETGSDKLYIDNSDTTTPLIYGNFFSNRVGINRIPALNVLEVEGNASKTTAGIWAANSDGRIKTDILTVSDGLEKLNKVHLVSFKYTDEYKSKHPSIKNQRYLNVIAQEFRQVFPDYVKSSGEKLPNGEEILQVDPYPVVIYAAAAVQELHGIVQEKDAKIADLEERLSKLEKLAAQLAQR